MIIFVGSLITYKFTKYFGEMDNWIKKNLSELLNFPVPGEMINYIHQMPNDQDLEDYMMTLLDFNDPKHRNFVQDLKKKRANEREFSGYRKPKDNVPGQFKQNQKKKNKGKENKDKEREIVDMPQQEKPEKSSGKRQKFTNLYSEGGKSLTVMLKGRHKCDCEAKIHDLINNCLNCGRIVCKQEREGPCFFCGELVCTPGQKAILQSNTKNSDQLYNKLMDQKPNKNQSAAIQQRDKLLEYDRNSTKRTQVIDDECDYYTSSTSVWLSKEERETMKQRDEKMSDIKHGSRLQKKVTLDLYGRTVLNENEDIDKILNEQFPLSVNIKNHGNNSAELMCPDFEFNRPEYVNGELTGYILSRSSINSESHRVQDKELLEMVDEGFCMSMHQPHASLLVAGIKIHEGRTWYSAHRGRLWIHAASKIPSTEEISALEHRYTVLNGNKKVKFPETYNTGCLLGFVTVVDVLPQEEYRKKYPDGESESPYVFICEDFYRLPLQLPMQGKHKIYKLEKKTHQAAVKCMKRFSEMSIH